MSDTGAVGKENVKKPRDGLMTERGRSGTLSPSNPEAERRISLNNKVLQDQVEWNEIEEPFIKKWIDYSNKYGIGYLLTNLQTGVYFNDNTKIVLCSDNQTVYYFEKGIDKKENKEIYSLQQYP